MTSVIEREQKIWEEIAKEIISRNPQKLPGEITVNEFCKRYHVGRDYARAELERLVREGELRARITSRAKYYSVT